MSGPKLMHITNDPKVIQRINNRLNTIGKENYFSSQIQSINIDIQNEMIWIKNYVNETMNNTSIQQDKVEYLHNSLIKIQNNYLIKLNSILLSNTIISEKSITELNNLIVSRIKELPRVKRELMRDILDKIDSIKIASFGITYWNELVKAYPSNVIYDELKFLARQYYQVTGMLVKSKVNFSNLLDQVMPKINDVLSNQGENHKLTEFVSRYIHFQNILDMGEMKFTSDYCKWAKKKGYRLNERKAAEILALAQNGIPTLPNSQSVKIAVSEAVKLIHSIEESRNTILAQMQDLCNTLPEYSVVKEMDCIGDTLAPRIIAEIGDVRRFKNKHSLIAYAGIDAPPYQSGAFHASERHISKRGNSYLRKTGYEIMQSLIKHKPADNAVYNFIQKKRSEGKCGKEAMIVGLNKFLRVYYGKVMEFYSEH